MKQDVFSWSSLKRRERTCSVLNMLVYGAMRIKKWHTIIDLSSTTRYSLKLDHIEIQPYELK